jgi:hypothetical protein
MATEALITHVVVGRHPADHRKRVRQERSQPIVDALHIWLLDRVERVSAVSDLG